MIAGKPTYIKIILSSLLLVACSSDNGKVKLLAEVDGERLYEDEITELSAQGLTSQDSIDIRYNRIKAWASDILYYNKAKENIKSSDEIDELVEKYRKSLIIYQYQLKLVSEGVDNKISDEDVMNYYTENESLFKATEPLFKGFYIIVPNSSSEIDAFRALSHQTDEVTYDVIESMCVKNAARFVYFQDGWQAFSEIQRNIPLHIHPSSLMRRKYVYENSDSTQTILFHVEDYKTEGEIQPFDYAKKKIEMIMFERKKAEFIKNYGNTLFNDAIKKGDLKLY